MTTLSTKMAVTGASGFVGTQLIKDLEGKGFQVLALSRQDLLLNPAELAQRLGGCHGVINLAGAPVVQRWSARYKKVMVSSRIALTRNLVSAFAMMAVPPKVFISTSATGIYGDDGIHTEENYRYGTGFLSRLAQQWEDEARQAKQYGVRTIIFRFGVVLGPAGGPLAAMLLPFKLGLGGKIGSGRQPFSWIHLTDLMRAYFFVLADEDCAGVYNLVAPHPSTNLGMTKALGKALCRPTLLTIPSVILQMRFGEGAQILTKGQHVLPERLLGAGFSFQFEDIDNAMADCVR